MERNSPLRSTITPRVLGVRQPDLLKAAISGRVLDATLVSGLVSSYPRTLISYILINEEDTLSEAVEWLNKNCGRIFTSNRFGSDLYTRLTNATI